MIKLFFYFFLFVNFFLFNAKAEVAYIDINHILKTSEVGKHLNLQINKKKNEI